MKRDFEIQFGDGIRIFAIIVLFVFMLISAGCRSTKEVVKTTATLQESTEIKANDQKKISQIDSSSIENKQSSTTKDSSFKKVTDIWFSKPDSLGNQHIERMTITDSGNVKQTFIESSDKKRTTSNKKEDSKHETIAEFKTTENGKQVQVTKLEPVAKWPIIIFSLGLIVLAYFVLKRFKILK